MAKLYNDFDKNLSKANRAVELDQMISKLEDDVRKLKVDFGIFFNGGTKRAPHEARGRIEATIKRLMDDRNLVFSQRYQLNSIVSGYNSHRELWRRLLKKKGEEIV